MFLFFFCWKMHSGRRARLNYKLQVSVQMCTRLWSLPVLVGRSAAISSCVNLTHGPKDILPPPQTPPRWMCGRPSVSPRLFSRRLVCTNKQQLYSDPEKRTHFFMQLALWLPPPPPYLGGNPLFLGGQAVSKRQIRAGQTGIFLLWHFCTSRVHWMYVFFVHSLLHPGSRCSYKFIN